MHTYVGTKGRTAQAESARRQTHVLSPLFTWRSAICSETSGLTPCERFVAMALSLHMSEKGDSCFPGVNTLAAETGYTARGVQKAIRGLESAGWLFVTAGGGRAHTNRYTAVIPERVNVVHRFRPERVNQEALKGERGSPKDVKRTYKDPTSKIPADNSHIDSYFVGAIDEAERLRVAAEMRELVKRL